MKLFLLSQNLNNGYDTYDSCVVCAESEDEARKIHPSEYESPTWYTEEDPLFCEKWVPPSQIDKIEVKYLGEAYHKVNKGIVCASYNEG